MATPYNPQAPYETSAPSPHCTDHPRWFRLLTGECLKCTDIAYKESTS